MADCELLSAFLGQLTVCRSGVTFDGACKQPRLSSLQQRHVDERLLKQSASLPYVDTLTKELC